MCYRREVAAHCKRSWTDDQIVRSWSIAFANGTSWACQGRRRFEAPEDPRTQQALVDRARSAGAFRLGPWIRPYTMAIRTRASTSARLLLAIGIAGVPMLIYRNIKTWYKPNFGRPARETRTDPHARLNYLPGWSQAFEEAIGSMRTVIARNYQSTHA
jgi:hypothetical protein